MELHQNIFTLPQCEKRRKIPKNLFNIKGTIIYGVDSNVFHKADVDWWTKKFTEFTMEAFPGEHLFPLEQPNETAELINKYL